jgi:hypothetical protein
MSLMSTPHNASPPISIVPKVRRVHYYCLKSLCHATAEDISFFCSFWSRHTWSDGEDSPSLGVVCDPHLLIDILSSCTVIALGKATMHCRKRRLCGGTVYQCCADFDPGNLTSRHRVSLRGFIREHERAVRTYNGTVDMSTCSPTTNLQVGDRTHDFIAGRSFYSPGAGQLTPSLQISIPT